MTLDILIISHQVPKVVRKSFVLGRRALVRWGTTEVKLQSGGVSDAFECNPMVKQEVALSLSCDFSNSIFSCLVSLRPFKRKQVIRLQELCHSQELIPLKWSARYGRRGHRGLRWEQSNVWYLIVSSLTEKGNLVYMMISIEAEYPFKICLSSGLAECARHYMLR